MKLIHLMVIIGVAMFAFTMLMAGFERTPSKEPEKPKEKEDDKTGYEL